MTLESPCKKCSRHLVVRNPDCANCEDWKSYVRKVTERELETEVIT